MNGGVVFTVQQGDRGSEIGAYLSHGANVDVASIQSAGSEKYFCCLPIAGVGIILDNLAKDNKDNAKFYLYLYLR